MPNEKKVFAHFVVGVAAAMSEEDWKSDIAAAKAAHIDGFALNIGAADVNNNKIIPLAYQAAAAVGHFTLFFSFDYGPTPKWSPPDVIRLINQYRSHPAQAIYRNKPLVSTFETDQNPGAWQGIKREANCFLIPDWTSLGPSGFTPLLQNSTADGFFSWDAWPAGATNMTTTPDTSWRNVCKLKDAPYMMPVSPWFYTSLPQYGKNWLSRGDGQWHDRWQQVIEFQPDLVEIISWNDFGESHYIGPIREPGIPDKAWYVKGMEHTGWLAMLPHYIDAYKAGRGGLSPEAIAGAPEKISYWYKKHLGQGGNPGGTIERRNTGAKLEDVLTDKIFLDVLVHQPSQVVVKIGDNQERAFAAEGPPGIKHFAVDLNGQTGGVLMQIKRDGKVVVSVKGREDIRRLGSSELINWNATTGAS